MSKYTAEQVEDTRRITPGVRGEMLGEFATLLREHESAKAAVTYDMINAAMLAYNVACHSQGDMSNAGYTGMRAALEAVAPMLASIQPPNMVCEQHPWSEWPHDDCAGPGMPGTAQYEALVYLAKLASAQVDQEPYCYTVEQKNGLSQGAMCRTKDECEASPLFDPDNDHIIPLYREPMLASARVPDERPELDPVKMNAEGKSVTEWERGYNEGWNDCRDAMLAAAPKPETEE